MGRLIDADECPCILCEDTRNAHCTYEHRSCEKFCNWLNNIAYDAEKVVEEIGNINTTWNCQECIHLETCDKIQMEKGSGSEHLDLCAEVVKVLSTDIVRNGGAE